MNHHLKEFLKELEKEENPIEKYGEIFKAIEVLKEAKDNAYKEVKEKGWM